MLDYQEPNTIARLFVNGVSGFDKTISGILYDDVTTYKLGASYYSAFIGTIFNFELFNYAVTDVSGLMSGSCVGGCSFCPASGSCIEPDAEEPGFVDAAGVEHLCGFLCEECSSETQCDRCAPGTFAIPGTN